MLPLHCMQNEGSIQIKKIKKCSMPCLRFSENESNNISIVFEDSSPKSTASSVDDLNLRIIKDLYKCQQMFRMQRSDNFILFTGDFEDCIYQYYCTTDDDFTA